MIKELIFKYTYTLPNATTADQIGVQTVSAVPQFTGLMLFFVWMLVFLGGSARQRARTGNSDFAAWGLVASMSILVLALIMSLVTGFVNYTTIGLIVGINIFCAFMLFFEHKATEV